MKKLIYRKGATPILSCFNVFLSSLALNSLTVLDWTTSSFRTSQTSTLFCRKLLFLYLLQVPFFNLLLFSFLSCLFYQKVIFIRFYQSTHHSEHCYQISFLLFSNVGRLNFCSLSSQDRSFKLGAIFIGALCILSFLPVCFFHIPI